MFCSRADHIAAVRFQAEAGCLSIRIQGFFPDIEYSQYYWGANYLPTKEYGVYDSIPVPPVTKIDHCHDGITLTGLYAYEKGGFVAAASLNLSGGSAQIDENGIHIKGADELVLLIDTELISNPCVNEARNLLERLSSVPHSFDELLKRHIAIHKPIFDRLSVDLGGDDEDYYRTTLELKKKQLTSQQIIPAYAEAMIDMGRFFLMNECGKFPPIYGHINVNINHQVSSGNIANLPEMMESFFRWIEWQLDDARDNSSRILGMRGFLLATHPDTESGRLYHTSKFWPHHYWISGSGWCLNPFIESYLCTGDDEFLRSRVMPLYYELSQLYEDFLTEKDENGKSIFVPSYSPESFPVNINVMTVINSTMDISVCREVLSTLLKYGPQVGVGTLEERTKWEALLNELPSYLVGEHGELKEWACADYEERYDHRHASHLYGAYPGDEFQPELNEELYRAAFIANRMRSFGNKSCHGVMHRAQCAARLKDAYLTEALLRFTLESGFINDNFTTVHNPYFDDAMPDGQGALPTVLIESLFYSRPGFLEPLPARPRESFRKGSINGIASRSFAHVDEFCWDIDKGYISLTISPIKDQSIIVCYRYGYESVNCDGIKEIDSSHARVYLKASKPVTITWHGVKG
jgi:hypothetical protein